MAIRIALHHETSYRYDRKVALSPHEIRLRPAPHARAPILSYSLGVLPAAHFLNWLQDPYGNFVGRLVFPEPSDVLDITVDLVADLAAINPFDFFLEPYAETFPFRYPQDLGAALAPCLQAAPAGPLLAAWVARAERELLQTPMATPEFVVAVNQRLQRDIGYLQRMEPGVQGTEETLLKRSGSCRDSGWLLVQVMRTMGLAARFVSGYLVQLRAGPGGVAADFADLHAWTEVYLPGAGWIGLDPTSGMLAAEGHIPLACAAMPSAAAPVSGSTGEAGVSFLHQMTVSRLDQGAGLPTPSDLPWQPE